MDSFIFITPSTNRMKFVYVKLCTYFGGGRLGGEVVMHDDFEKLGFVAFGH